MAERPESPDDATPPPLPEKPPPLPQPDVADEATAEEEEPQDTLSRARKGITEFGGGFYGLVGLATFAVLEVLALLHAVRAAIANPPSLSDLFGKYLIGFSMESIYNGIWAGMWPISWWNRFGWHAAWMAAVAWVLHEPILRLIGWRAEDEEDAEEPAAEEATG